jgi:clan AA aspartic protease (TIGR02281 family)
MIQDLIKLTCVLGVLLLLCYTPSGLNEAVKQPEGMIHQAMSALGTTLQHVTLTATGGETIPVQATKPEGGRSPLAGVSPPSQEVQVSLDPYSKALAVDAVLNNQVSGRFIVDTGATYTAITADTAEKLHLDLANTTKIPIMTANGRIWVPKIRLQKLQLGALVANEVEVTVLPVRETPHFSGLLGLNFTNRYIMTVDPVQGRLMFKPLASPVR